MSSDEILEESVEYVNKKGMGGVKSIAVFTYIGKLLLFLAATGVFVTIFISEDYMVNKVKDADISSDQWVLETKIYCLIIMLTSIGAIVGARKMTKRKRQGFFLHAASNIVFIAFLLYNANIAEFILAGVSVLFILLYLRYLKRLDQ
ncbi:MAG: hypothetical protein HUJ25_09895 [Crocinitomicaceae bacterium]|nr:hypothetical protein [Crocinitomicaceae bacterium]